MKKYEWRKELKKLYLPKKEPTKIEVPNMQFFTIEVVEIPIRVNNL